jgi:calcium-dependent protein kinase
MRLCAAAAAAAMNKLKKEALKVIAANLPMDEITGLKEMFHSMDKDLRCD